MKIFYFQAKEELKQKQTAISLLKNANNGMVDELQKANQKADENYKLFKNEHKEHKKSKKYISQLNAKIIDLEKQLIDAKNEFEEFKKGKYIVKEIPEGRTPNTQKMKFKSSARTSQIIKKVKDE